MRADGDAPQPDPAGKPQAPPDLGEALHALGADSRAGLKAASESLKALRILVAADFSLARSAFGRALAFTGVAIAFGASSWLLLMAALLAEVAGGPDRGRRWRHPGCRGLSMVAARFLDAAQRHAGSGAARNCRGV